MVVNNLYDSVYCGPGPDLEFRVDTTYCDDPEPDLEKEGDEESE